MNKFKELFVNLDKTDLKIMKFGLKVCFIALIVSTIILLLYLFFSYYVFLYEIGINLFKFSTYIAVEFVVCGIIADTIKKQID